MTKIISHVFLLLFVASSCFADWTDIPSTSFSLPPYPALGSYESNLDFELLHKYQDERGPEQCELAQSQIRPTFEAFYGNTAGFLSEREVAILAPFMGKVFDFTHRVSSYFKGKFQRPRPYAIDNSIEPCIEKVKGARAYPSSHASMSAVGACVLAEFFYKKEKRILEYGKYLGDLRAIVGVHHPSDVIAGQRLAEQICYSLGTNREFQEEFEQIRQQL